MEGRKDQAAPIYGLLAWSVEGAEVVPVQAGNVRRGPRSS
jgi:hypothetical protein